MGWAGLASEVAGQDLACEVGDAPLIGEGKLPGQLLDGDPGNVHGLLVGIVLDGQFTAGGTQQVVVHGLVDPVPADGKPVVDAAQGGQDGALDAGFLGDFSDRRLFIVLFALRVALGQAPLEASPRLRRAIIATRSSASDVSTTTPPAETSSTVGSDAGAECGAGATCAPIADGNGAFVLLPGALGTGWAMESTLTTVARS